MAAADQPVHRLLRLVSGRIPLERIALFIDLELVLSLTIIRKILREDFKER